VDVFTPVITDFNIKWPFRVIQDVVVWDKCNLMTDSISLYNNAGLIFKDSEDTASTFGAFYASQNTAGAEAWSIFSCKTDIHQS